MRRRSKAGGERAKTRRRKMATLKRRNAPKIAPHRGLSAAILNKKVALFKRERDEARERETATANILGVIASSPDSTQPVFEAIVNSGLKLFPGATISIAVPVADQVTAAAVAQPDPVRAESWRGIFPFPLTRDYMHGLAILDAKIVDVPDVTNAPPDLALGAQNFLKSGYKAVTILPMMCGISAIGALSVIRIQPGPLSAEQVALLKSFAAQAVIAIENTRLLNELRQSLEQQTATADVLKVISHSTFDLQTVLTTLVESGARLCEADRANVWRPSGDGYKIAAGFALSPEHEEVLKRRIERPGRGSCVGRTLLEGKTVHIIDAQADPEYKWPENLSIGVSRSMLGVPLMREGIPIGVLVVTRSTVRPFTEKQIELIETFADQAVIAIENVRLFEAEQQRTRELSESLEQQTATSEVLRVISSSPSELELVFEAILENATRICAAKFGILCSYDGNLFKYAAARNAPPAFLDYLLQRGSFPPRPGTALDRLLKTTDVVHHADVSVEDVPSDSARLAGARSHLAVPMFKDEALVGAIVIYRQEVRPFTDKQIALVQNFAAQAVIAIENTRLLNELRESLAQQTATSEVLGVISSSPGELEPVFQNLLDNATRLCVANFGLIAQYNGNSFQLMAQVGADQDYFEYLRVLKRWPAASSGLAVPCR